MGFRLSIAVGLAGLCLSNASCSDDDAASAPTIVERTDEVPTGEAGRDGCEPASRAFDVDADGRFDSPDEAFLVGVSEHDIPGTSVVAVSEGPGSVQYYSYDGDDLRAITEVTRAGNGLWVVGGARFCE